MSDVVDRITARLDAMETAARAAGPYRWTADGGDVYVGHPTAPIVEFLESSWAAHIALNDPAAVLAMVAGLRAVVALHQPVDYSGLGMKSPNACELCGIDAGMSDWEWLRDSYPCPTIQAIAAMWPDTDPRQAP